VNAEFDNTGRSTAVSVPEGRWYLEKDAVPTTSEARPRPNPVDPTPDSVVIPHPDVVWTQVNDEVVVFSASTATSFVLDSMAALLWESLDPGAALVDLLRVISDNFAVDLERVMSDFLPLVALWLHNGILVEVS
jgi:hypothetical protein